MIGQKKNWGDDKLEVGNEGGVTVVGEGWGLWEEGPGVPVHGLHPL